MDFLEANQDVLEEAIYFRTADLLNLDVELVFYDTTSLHFEIDEEDEGDGSDGGVCGSLAAGSKRYTTPRERGHSKNGRCDAPQIVIGLAVTRDDFPLRHWIFPGNTVDVTTLQRVKEELKGWRLNRCVFVGDVGRVSKDHLAQLARGGGRYIVCMPIHRIHAHVALTVLALLLERVDGHACADTWRNIRDDLKQITRAFAKLQRQRLAGHRARPGGR